jgi:predicted nucleotidyltransferase
VTSLASASLSAIERQVLDRFVRLVQDEYGDNLRSIWLYGSRARGEEPHAESDVDLLVVLEAESESLEDFFRLGRLMDDAAEAGGASPVFFSVHVYDRARLEQRRQIRSFFIQEVDRDKIVLAGEP